MFNYKAKYNKQIRVISFLMALLIIYEPILPAENLTTLSPMPGTQNPDVKRRIMAALARTRIRYAKTPDAINLLRDNNTSCLLLSSGNILITEEVANDDVKLLGAVIHEEIEAIMQIISVYDHSKYQGIKELVFKHAPPQDNMKPPDLYVNHIIAEAIEYMTLERLGIAPGEIIADENNNNLKKIMRIINSYRSSYFTKEFWDPQVIDVKIREAMRKGMIFYQVSSGFSPGDDKRNDRDNKDIQGEANEDKGNGHPKHQIKEAADDLQNRIIELITNDCDDIVKGNRDLSLSFLEEKNSLYRKEGKIFQDAGYPKRVIEKLIRLLSANNEKVRIFSAWSLIPVIENSHLEDDQVRALLEIWHDVVESFRPRISRDSEEGKIFEMLFLKTSEALEVFGKHNADAIIKWFQTDIDSQIESFDFILKIGWIVKLLSVIHDDRVPLMYKRYLNDMMDRDKEWSEHYGTNAFEILRLGTMHKLKEFPEYSSILVPVLFKAVCKYKYPRKKEGLCEIIREMIDRSSLPYIVEATARFKKKYPPEKHERLYQGLKNEVFSFVIDIRKTDPEYYDHVKNVFELLREPWDTSASPSVIEADFNSRLNLLGRLLREKPEYTADILPAMIELFPEEKDLIVELISSLSADRSVENVVEYMIRKYHDVTAKETAAVIMCQWACYGTPNAARRSRARKCLSEILGKRRTHIFNRYGVWIIDIRVPDDMKFTDKDIDRIETTLEKIPKKHIYSDLVRAIVKTYPYEYVETPPEWLYYDGENGNAVARKVQLLGSYSKSIKTVYLNDTEEIEDTVAHEVGHGVYDHYLNREQRRAFDKLHDECVKFLPDLNARHIPNSGNPNFEHSGFDYSDFAYSYGAHNSSEDFATIYEKWIMHHDELIERTLKSERLKKKLEIVTVDVPRRADIMEKLMEFFKKAMKIKFDPIQLLPQKEFKYLDEDLVVVLINDLVWESFKLDRKYTIKYDASRLSQQQVNVIKAYCTIIRSKIADPKNIRLQPFSGSAGSTESLIAVYCTGPGFAGEGHVNVQLPSEDNICDYVLRISGMINIAFAAAHIPNGISEDEFNDEYSTLVGFILNQYKSILDVELPIPGNFNDKLDAIRCINLQLPKIYKLPDQLIQYNRLALNTLVAA